MLKRESNINLLLGALEALFQRTVITISKRLLGSCKKSHHTTRHGRLRDISKCAFKSGAQINALFAKLRVFFFVWRISIYIK